MKGYTMMRFLFNKIDLDPTNEIFKQVMKTFKVTKEQLITSQNSFDLDISLNNNAV